MDAKNTNTKKLHFDKTKSLLI